MSQVHWIIAFLILFLIGRVGLTWKLLPTIIAATRERTLPRILVRGLELALDWMTIYFVLLLLNYYHIIKLPKYSSVILAGLAAAVPWTILYWRWRWREQLDREATKENQ